MTLLTGNEKKFVEEQVKLQVEFYLGSWENARMDGQDVEFEVPELMATLIDECKTSVMIDHANQVNQRNRVMNSVDEDILKFLISGEIHSQGFRHLVKGF